MLSLGNVNEAPGASRMYDQIVAFVQSLNTSNWIAIIALAVSCLSLFIAQANFRAGRRERNQRKMDEIPVVQATINKDTYPNGWRSVQLHLVPRNGDWRSFPSDDWRIVRARLIRPWYGVVLARAQNDDYAARIFYPDNPIRLLIGKAEGKLQRFALEFFIKFGREDRGGRAKFKVVYAHIKAEDLHIVKVWASVPMDAVRHSDAPGH